MKKSPAGTWELYGRNTDLDRFATLAGLADPRAVHQPPATGHRQRNGP
ncbi:hypothetical protein [Streptomyces sp. NPDC047981]